MLGVILLAAATFVMPPPSEGVIDGKEALLIWPSDEQNRLIDPAGCTVHMIPGDEPEAHLEYPCGRWFLPPRPGRYDIWTEQENRLGGPTVIYYGGGSASAGSRIAFSSQPAGFLRIAAPLREGQTFRIISLGDTGFERRLRPAELRPTVRVPAGSTLGGIFDADGNALALTRAVEVNEASTVTMTPSAPAAGTGDLQIVLNKWGAKRPSSVQFELQTPKGNRPPDVRGETQSRVIAVWYGVAPGSVRAVVTAEGFESAVLPVDLSADRVSTVRSPFPIRTND
ncbi:MAG TPA: hypothetical protein VGQ76_11475 [Thermoanaerobaculia bacterium]|jgi:hypothetical protein|nr:hypothetical protein [Thermoanaerobaculia bacterium]